MPYVNAEQIQIALESTDLPHAVKEFWTEEQLVAIGRTGPKSPLRFIRSGNNWSPPLWDAEHVRKYFAKRYNKIAPKCVAQFIATLNRIIATENVERANRLDRERAKAAKPAKK